MRERDRGGDGGEELRAQRKKKDGWREGRKERRDVDCGRYGRSPKVGVSAHLWNISRSINTGSVPRRPVPGTEGSDRERVRYSGDGQRKKMGGRKGGNA